MGGKHKKEGSDESVEVVMTSDEDVTSAVSDDDSEPGTSLLVGVSAVQSLGRPTPQQAIGWSSDHMLRRDTDTGNIIPFGFPSVSSFHAIHFPSTTVDSILGDHVPVALGFEDYSGTGSLEDCVWDADSDDERQGGFLANYHAQWDGQSASETTSATEYESSGEFLCDQSDDGWGEESYETQWPADESEWDAMLIASYEAQWDLEEQSERDMLASSLASDEMLWDGLSDTEYDFASSLASDEELWDDLSDVESLASHAELWNGFSELQYEFPTRLWGRVDQRDWDSESHESDSRSAYYGDGELDEEEEGNAAGERIDPDEECDMQTVVTILTSVTELEERSDIDEGNAAGERIDPDEECDMQTVVTILTSVTELEDLK
ncbi:hypothetical protein AB1N83_013481 [Pleurotus pulmonarius]